MIDEADRNGDGQVDEEEFMRIMKYVSDAARKGGEAAHAPLCSTGPAPGSAHRHSPCAGRMSTHPVRKRCCPAGSGAPDRPMQPSLDRRKTSLF